MATEFQKINKLPTTTIIGANDYLTLHDGNGSCKKMKCTDLQGSTPLPTIWQNIILSDVRIMFCDTGLKSVPVSQTNANAHSGDFLGLYLPEVDTIVYPQPVEALPWGNDPTKNSANMPASESDTEYRGLSATIQAYNDSPQNQTTDCAVGYVQNFERYSNGKGFGKGKWYLPCMAETKKILMPYYEKLKYASSLFGIDWGSDTAFWMCYDFSKANAHYFNTGTGTRIGCGKDVRHRSLMFANGSASLDNQPT